LFSAVRQQNSRLFFSSTSLAHFVCTFCTKFSDLEFLCVSLQLKDLKSENIKISK